MNIIVYTKNGSRYILNQEKMEWTTEDLYRMEFWYKLSEWPVIEEGQPLTLKYLDDDQKREKITTEVTKII